MMMNRAISAVMVAFATAAVAALTACEPEMKSHAGSHDYAPEHGGEVIHLKDHGPMMEVVHDDKAGTLKLFVYDAHHKAAKCDKPPVANLEEGPTQVTATGAGAEWTFTHEKLKGHPHIAGIKISVGGEEFNNSKWHPAEK